MKMMIVWVMMMVTLVCSRNVVGKSIDQRVLKRGILLSVLVQKVRYRRPIGDVYSFHQANPKNSERPEKFLVGRVVVVVGGIQSSESLYVKLYRELFTPLFRPSSTTLVCRRTTTWPSTTTNWIGRGYGYDDTRRRLPIHKSDPRHR